MYTSSHTPTCVCFVAVARSGCREADPFSRFSSRFGTEERGEFLPMYLDEFSFHVRRWDGGGAR